MSKNSAAFPNKDLRSNHYPLFVLKTKIGEEVHYFQGVTEKPINDPKTGVLLEKLKVNVWIPTFEDATLYLSRRAAKNWLKILGTDGIDLLHVGYCNKVDYNILRLPEYAEVSAFPRNVWLEGYLLEKIEKEEQGLKSDIIKAYDLEVGDTFKPSMASLQWYEVTQIFGSRVYYKQVTQHPSDRPATESMTQGQQRVILLKQKHGRL